MKTENEDLRLLAKVYAEQDMYRFEILLKRIFGEINVETEVIRENKRPGFGNFFTYFHIHYPEGGGSKQ